MLTKPVDMTSSYRTVSGNKVRILATDRALIPNGPSYPIVGLITRPVRTTLNTDYVTLWEELCLWSPLGQPVGRGGADELVEDTQVFYANCYRQANGVKIGGLYQSREIAKMHQDSVSSLPVQIIEIVVPPFK